MTWEHLHLVTHSFPIVLTISGAAVGLAGWLRDSEVLENWALGALVIAAAFVAPAYLTGLAAADVVTERLFSQEGTVQTHRFWATWAAVPMFTAGVLAAFALHDGKDRLLRHVAFLVALLGAALVGYAAWIGATIEHAW